MPTRQQLLDAAVRLLEAEGPEALQARRLAGEIGASTMAVYTHFGGMPGLLDAVTRNGLARFAEHVREVPETDDPVADLLAGGLAYSSFALANPQLYRLVFGLASVDAGGPWATPEGRDAFSVLLGHVDRVIEAGRFDDGDALAAATKVLATTHGFLLLVLGGFIADSGQDVGALIGPLTVDLMVGLGDSREAAQASLAQALA